MSDRGLMLFDKDGNAGLQFVVREMRKRDGRVVGIKCGVALVTLKESKKEWVSIDRMGGGHITANGYRETNRKAGLTIMEPPTIFVENVGWVSNPHSDIDPKTGAWLGGKLRLVAFGRDAWGNMVATDYTNRMTLGAVLNEGLLAVRKRRPTAVLWGFKETSPADIMAEALYDWNDEIDSEIEEAKRRRWKDKSWKRNLQYSDAHIRKAVEKTSRRVKARLWAFRIVIPADGLGIWYDIQDAEVAKACAGFSRGDEIGIRKLKGTTYRNVSRDHPANPGMVLGPDEIFGTEEGYRVARVQVYFHDQVDDRAELEELMHQFADGVDVAGSTVVRGAQEIKHAEVDNSDDDEPEEGAQAAPEADERPPAEPARKTEVRATTPDAQIEAIRVMANSLPDEVVCRIVSQEAVLEELPAGELDRIEASLREWSDQ